MADENKTLLRFEGDASSVKRAAEEGRAALAEVQQAVSAGSQSAASDTQASTAALEGQTEAAKEGAEGVEGLGQSFSTSQNEARAFAMAVGRISPELASLISIGARVEQIFKFVFTPAGALVAGVVAAIGLVSKAWEEAKQKAQEYEEANERIRKGTVEAGKAMAIEMAKAGKGGEKARDVAMAEAKRLEEKGFAPEAARQVAAAVTTPEGKIPEAPEEREQLAAWVETERGDLGGKTQRERDASLKRMKREIGRRPEEAAEAVTALKYPKEQEVGAIGKGETFGTREYLKQKEGMQEGEGLEEAIREIEQVRKTGSAAEAPSSPWDVKSWWNTFLEHSNWVAPIVGHEKLPERTEKAQRRIDAMQQYVASRQPKEPEAGAGTAAPGQPAIPSPPPPNETLGLEFGPGEAPLEPAQAAAGVSEAPPARPRVQASLPQGQAGVSRAVAKPVEMVHERMNEAGEWEKVPPSPQTARGIPPEAKPARVEAEVGERARGREGEGETGSGWSVLAGKMDELIREVRGQAAQGPPGGKATAPGAGGQAGVTVQNFGTMHLAPDDRFAKSPRMRAAG